jgi:ParB family chromosome partitioning protein
MAIDEMLASAEERQRDRERAAQLLGETEQALGVVVQEIPLDAIEPDPGQPRRVFDEEKLATLAASIRRYGLLQEPGVVTIAADAAGLPTRFRIIWGERRWRACSMAGMRTIRCKVLPRTDETAAAQLRTKEKQWAENMEREGLSPVEEAIAIHDAAEIERQENPGRPIGELIEKVGAQRGFNGMVARNLVGLLKTPKCLQAAMLKREIGREVGFELARYWNRLLGEQEQQQSLKREIKFRNLVAAWAAARGLDLDAQAMGKYAAETFQDPKVVKATCRKAEEFERAVVTRLEAVVERARTQKWTVAKAKAALGSGAREERRGGGRKLLFERAGVGGARVTIHLERVHDPARARDPSLDELLELLRNLTRDVEAVQAEGARGCGEVAAEDPCNAGR